MDSAILMSIAILIGVMLIVFALGLRCALADVALNRTFLNYFLEPTSRSSSARAGP
jgi:hypothetical protein